MSISHRKLIIVLFLIGSLLRFYQLDLRPVHHDESLHGFYSREQASDPEQKFYRYNPMLHGPLLYNVIASSFELFGANEFALRLPNAVLGSLLILTPLLFNLSAVASVTFSLLVALSPSLTYWSRFAHHDYLVLSSYLLFALGLLRVGRGGVILCCLSFALQYTIKANVFVFAAQLLGFVLFDLLVSRGLKRNSIFSQMLTALYSREFALGAGLAALVFSTLYSAKFRYIEGILDGLYRKVFAYWLNQHQIQRLDGPFSYNLLAITLYDLPILVLFLTLLFRELARLKLLRIVGVFSLILALVALVPSPELFAPNGALKLHLKLSGRFDLWFAGVVAILPVLLTYSYLKREEKGLAIISYLCLSTIFSYGYLGEKVPWLSSYSLVGMILYSVCLIDCRESEIAERTVVWTKPLRLILSGLTIFLILSALQCIFKGDQRVLGAASVELLVICIAGNIVLLIVERLLPQRKFPLAIILLGVCFALSLKANLLTNFSRAGADTELLAQVHTTRQMHETLLALKRHLQDPLETGERKVLVAENSVWPGTWYLGGNKGFYFQSNEVDSFDYLILNENSTLAPAEFSSRVVDLQWWWVPDYQKMRLSHLLEYYLKHEPWNPTGSLRVKLYSAGVSLNFDDESWDEDPE
jgi:uncharacterized protein (TIGR03663 family)